MSKKKSKKKSKSPTKASASSAQTTNADKAKPSPLATTNKPSPATVAEKAQASSTKEPETKEASPPPARSVSVKPPPVKSVSVTPKGTSGTASGTETPKVASKEPPQAQGKDAWNPLSVGFNGLGVLVGLTLLLFGVSNTYKLFDGLWLEHLGESKGFVVSVTEAADAKGKSQYVTVISLPKVGRFPQAKVKIIDRRLYDYVKYRYHPPRALRIKVERVHRRLSGQAGIAKAGPFRLLHPPKSADLIIGLGLLLLGGGICFSSLRDLHKRWLRRGLLA